MKNSIGPLGSQSKACLLYGYAFHQVQILFSVSSSGRFENGYKDRWQLGGQGWGGVTEWVGRVEFGLPSRELLCSDSHTFDDTGCSTVFPSCPRSYCQFEVDVGWQSICFAKGSFCAQVALSFHSILVAVAPDHRSVLHDPCIEQRDNGIQWWDDPVGGLKFWGHQATNHFSLWQLWSKARIQSLEKRPRGFQGFEHEGLQWVHFRISELRGLESCNLLEQSACHVVHKTVNPERIDPGISRHQIAKCEGFDVGLGAM